MRVNGELRSPATRTRRKLWPWFLSVSSALAVALLLITAPVVGKSGFRDRTGASAVPHDPLPPRSGGYFDTLPAGAELPEGAWCREQVRRSVWEPRPQNAALDREMLPEHALPPSPSFTTDFNRRFLPLIDGDFRGTTDETMQWASCKWGFDDDLTRAQAYMESTWRGDARGDRTMQADLCPPAERAPLPCPQSFGVMQLKARYYPGSYPLSAASLAFSLDYALAQQRGCYEGMLFAGPNYASGDLWGCMGFWYSGRWRDQAAEERIVRLGDVLDRKPWLKWHGGPLDGRPADRTSEDVR